MVWNDQQNSQYSAATGVPPAPPMADVPNAPSVPAVPAYYMGSPLQGPLAQPVSQMPGAYPPGTTPVGTASQSPMPQSSLMPGQVMPFQAAGMPAVSQPPMPVAAPGSAVADTDGDGVDVDDVEWVNRAKRAIASSSADPHRQVQLIQHLRALYLKERYGRTVHTDEA